MKNKTRRLALGVDFGGTSIKIGLVNGRGRILNEQQFATADFNSRSRWLELIGNQIARHSSKGRRPAGIGVGVPGFADFSRGFVYNITNVPGWAAVPLSKIMRKQFRMPVYVDNDVNAMALGEHTYGAGRGLKHAFFVTLGTGVGGALVIDGKIYRGAHSMAGEIGHVPITRQGRKTPEGRGGLETFVGSQRIVERAVRALRNGKKSCLLEMASGDLKLITPKIIAKAAKRGDQLSLEIMDYLADCLATAFAAVTYLLQPEAIIVGGGMAGSGEVLFGPLRRHFSARLHEHFAERIKIVPAALGAQAGMIGCAALVFQNHRILNFGRS